jgi:hypothetical protein
LDAVRFLVHQAGHETSVAAQREATGEPRRLVVSRRAVQTCLTYVYNTLGLRSRIQLMQEAGRHG